MPGVAALLLPALGLAAQAPPPVFPTGVGLVEVPVIVSDPQGRFVPDLTRADLEISERGVPQAITAFERVSIPLPLAAPAAASPPTPADVATNGGLADGRIFVLVQSASGSDGPACASSPAAATSSPKDRLAPPPPIHRPRRPRRGHRSASSAAGTSNHRGSMRSRRRRASRASWRRSSRARCRSPAFPSGSRPRRSAVPDLP